MTAMFDAKVWAAVPFHFWSLTLFVFGCMVGSFLNVCIYRMPRGESVVSPPSHCPHCNYSIPWYLNIPLVTWVYLRGRCANCKAPISVRYFLVELLTGLCFLACWLAAGQDSGGVALVYCLVAAGFIAATFIDFEHLIIPDEITLGGMAAGFVCSALVPALHGMATRAQGMKASFLGILVGGGAVMAILQIGKLAFGRQKIKLPPGSKIVFNETSLALPDREIPYEDIFFRRSDTIRLHARRVECPEVCYWDVAVSLSPERLQIGDQVMKPEEMPRMEMEAEKVVLPREAMGLGDVKFMAAIGAFLGWPATLFALMVSSVIGALVGLVLIAVGKHEWSGRLPYGPYIALAAMVWMLGGRKILSLVMPI